MSDLEATLAKLRRATEFALAYPDQMITRSEAHALLDERDRYRATLERLAAHTDRFVAQIAREALDAKARR